MRLEKVPLVVMSLTSVCAQECVEVTNRGNKAAVGVHTVISWKSTLQNLSAVMMSATTYKVLRQDCKMRCCGCLPYLLLAWPA